MTLRPASPRDFSPAPISCPGCRAFLPGASERCLYCGYNAWTCVDRFPYNPPPLDRYVDAGRFLSSSDRARMDKVIDALEDAFPQVRLHVCLVKLPSGTDARECGFWLLNASVPRDEEESARRPWCVLLVIDLLSSTASATVGYGLDPYVRDDDLYLALEAAKKGFAAGHFRAGIIAFARRARQFLRRAHRLALRSRHSLGKGPLSRHTTAVPRPRHPEY